MSSLLKVAREEYLRLAKKRSFKLALIGMPLFIGVVIAVAIIAVRSGLDVRPVGYVDLSGVTAALTGPTETGGFESVTFVPYADETAARAATETGGIRGYFLLEPDYLQTRRVQFFSPKGDTSGEAQSRFVDLLRGQMVAQAPAENRKVLASGIEFLYRKGVDGPAVTEGGFAASFILPFVIGFFFVMVVMSSGGYLLQAVTSEKENRMMEVMITSVSPLQLIAGKAVGLIGVALTQVVVWLAALGVVLAVAAPRVSFLANISVPWGALVAAAVFFLPTYVLLAGMMITVGGMVTELQHGQQVAGLFNLLFAVPFFFLVLIFTNPDSPILVGLSLFPTTAMMTIVMRYGVTTIPIWQLVASFVICVLAAWGSIWVAARVFRLGMLSYGQPLSVATLTRLLRTERRAARQGA